MTFHKEAIELTRLSLLRTNRKHGRDQKWGLLIYSEKRARFLLEKGGGGGGEVIKEGGGPMNGEEEHTQIRWSETVERGTGLFRNWLTCVLIHTDIANDLRNTHLFNNFKETARFFLKTVVQRLMGKRKCRMNESEETSQNMYTGTVTRQCLLWTGMQQRGY